MYILSLKKIQLNNKFTLRVKPFYIQLKSEKKVGIDQFFIVQIVAIVFPVKGTLLTILVIMDDMQF